MELAKYCRSDLTFWAPCLCNKHYSSLLVSFKKQSRDRPGGADYTPGQRKRKRPVEDEGNDLATPQSGSRAKKRLRFGTPSTPTGRPLTRSRTIAVFSDDSPGQVVFAPSPLTSAQLKAAQQTVAIQQESLRRFLKSKFKDFFLVPEGLTEEETDVFFSSGLFAQLTPTLYYFLATGKIIETPRDNRGIQNFTRSEGRLAAFAKPVEQLAKLRESYQFPTIIADEAPRQSQFTRNKDFDTTYSRALIRYACAYEAYRNGDLGSYISWLLPMIHSLYGSGNNYIAEQNVLFLWDLLHQSDDMLRWLSFNTYKLLDVKIEHFNSILSRQLPSNTIIDFDQIRKASKRALTVNHFIHDYKVSYEGQKPRTRRMRDPDLTMTESNVKATVQNIKTWLLDFLQQTKRDQVTIVDYQKTGAAGIGKKLAFLGRKMESIVPNISV